MIDVTVLMSVYNGEAFLGHAIDGILRQTFQYFEFVIVDDGSTDDSASIVRSFADPRIVFVQNERNLGLSKSLNRGLALARGALVARQDADDISLPTRLARQVAYLGAHPNVSLVGSAYEEIDATGRASAAVTLPCATDEIRWALLFYCPLVHGAVLVRKAALEDGGGYNEEYAYAQDYDLWTRMAPTHRMINLEDVLVQYRVSPSSMTSTHPAVATEPLRIGVAAVRALSGWVQDGTPALEDRLHDMQRMLRTETYHDVPRDPGRALRDIFFLHDAFCARSAISALRRRVLRRDLVQRVAANLVYHAKGEARAGRYGRAVKLAADAARLKVTLVALGMRPSAITLVDADPACP